MMYIIIIQNIKSTSQITKSILLNKTNETNKDNSELDFSKSHKKNESLGKIDNINKSLISKYVLINKIGYQTTFS